jgi:mannitol/fructose-specific phosphotransferase system IIA component (Ntr-type)
MNAIRLNVSCSDWRSAIREAGRVLMECGAGETVPVDIIMMLAINDPSAQIDMLRKVSFDGRTTQSATVSRTKS